MEESITWKGEKLIKALTKDKYEFYISKKIIDSNNALN